MDIPASNWTEADASNSTAAPDGWPEGMAPSGVNDSGRAMMGAVKRWYDWTIPLVTGGTSTAYTLSYTVAPGALVDGMSHLVQFNAVNGANPTLNVNSLGAKPITFYCGGSWSTGTNTMPPFMLGVDQVVRLVYNAAAGTYRCFGLPLVLKQTVSGAATIDFTNIPTNVNNLQLLGQVTASVNAVQLLMRTYTSAGAVSSGASDYSFTSISWQGSLSAVSTTTGTSIQISGAMDSATAGTFDITAAGIQSTNNPAFNFGSQNTGSAAYTATRGVGSRNAAAIISGVRLLGSSGNLTGTATLVMS